MKDFLSKIDMGARVFIIAIFGISVIYCILSGITRLFRKEKVDNKINVENIKSYITIYSEDTGDSVLDDSKLVKDYNVFYNVQSALQNYIEALLDEQYSQTYNVLSDEMKAKYSKKEYVKKIKSLVDSYFINDDLSYEISYCLKKAYIIDDYMYLCECKTIYDQIVNIGIKLNDTNNRYEVFYIDFDIQR